MNNFIIILLDGVGVGELPDAHKYGDVGSNTLGNISEQIKNFKLPNLEAMGLGNIIPMEGIPKVSEPIASFGKMNEKAPGKDSTSGHWEIAGLELKVDFPYYPNGFPDNIIKAFLKLTGCKGVLGNKPASGTEIIKELGNEHVKTGFPIIYTSADSVFQIAAHEEIIPLDKLYDICDIARNQILIGKDSVGRVIARPFIGDSGNYSRTTNRKDFSIDPPEDTILDVLKANAINTIAIGKINDLFNYKGISESIISKSNEEGVKKLRTAIQSHSNSFIFINLVDFDVYFGHRNDPQGFADALKFFDTQLQSVLDLTDNSDALVITADHGNDPTTPSTDHSREYIPLLFYQKGKASRDLGIRETFADIAQTAAEFFKVKNELKGTSFLEN